MATAMRSFVMEPLLMMDDTQGFPDGTEDGTLKRATPSFLSTPRNHTPTMLPFMILHHPDKDHHKHDDGVPLCKQEAHG